MSQLPISRVQLIGKPDCHLCQEARAVVATVCAELDLTWVEHSILDDHGLYDQYWERIPLVLVDEKIVGFWRIDPEHLRGILSE